MGHVGSGGEGEKDEACHGVGGLLFVILTTSILRNDEQKWSFL
jgi:hypothetical protein